MATLTNQRTAYFNGANVPEDEVRISFRDRGFRLGDAAFDMTRTFNGVPFKLLPEEQFEGYEDPEPWLPRLPKGTEEIMPHLPGHYQEWIRACKGDGTPMSNFDYAARLTETVLLGNGAIAAGHPVDWDGERLRFTNCSEANDLVHREYEDGYSL